MLRFENLVSKSRLLAGGGEYFPYELIAIIFAFTVFIVVGPVYLAIKFLILKHKHFNKKDETEKGDKVANASKNATIKSDEENKTNTTKKDEK